MKKMKKPYIFISHSSKDNAAVAELVDDLQAAVQLAEQNAQRGWLVLFSPACASFDMFKNYQERGESFIRIVKEMLQ